MAHLIRVALTVLRLRAAALSLGDVRPADVDAFVSAAMDEQTASVPAALLVALGWGESRFDASAGPACGAMQVYPGDLGLPWAACAAWAHDTRAGVRAGVQELELMLADGRVRGDLRRALLYRACGNAAFQPGACAMDGWVNAAIARFHTVNAWLHDSHTTAI